LIDLLRTIFPHPHLQKLRRILKDQLNDLDELRDTQVMLVDVTEALTDLPEVESLQKFLNKRERRLLRYAKKSIKFFNYSSVRKGMEAVRKKILKQKLETVHNSVILQVVDDRFETVIYRYRHIDPVYPASIHRTRVAFKKFRYMVEIIHPLVPNFPEKNFKLMANYQGLMGDIQDVEVLLSTFEDFAEGEISYNPEPVFKYYRQRYSEVANAFIEDMHQINMFWRNSPESPFPWESRRIEPGLGQEDAGKREQLAVKQETRR
jgi:CHAD domain-containing protein